MASDLSQKTLQADGAWFQFNPISILKNLVVPEIMVVGKILKNFSCYGKGVERPHISAGILTTEFVLYPRFYTFSFRVNIMHLELGVLNSAVTVKVFRADLSSDFHMTSMLLQGRKYH